MIRLTPERKEKSKLIHKATHISGQWPCPSHGPCTLPSPKPASLNLKIVEPWMRWQLLLCRLSGVVDSIWGAPASHWLALFLGLASTKRIEEGRADLDRSARAHRLRRSTFGAEHRKKRRREAHSLRPLQIGRGVLVIIIPTAHIKSSSCVPLGNSRRSGPQRPIRHAADDARPWAPPDFFGSWPARPAQRGRCACTSAPLARSSRCEANVPGDAATAVSGHRK